jgi:hypothetical protein
MFEIIWYGHSDAILIGSKVVLNDKSKFQIDWIDLRAMT